jgi:toxin ParE2
MRVVSHPEADEELEQAVLWYEERQSGLGGIFLDEFERTLQRILEDPETPRIIRHTDRKLNFRRFPYAIVYTTRDEVLYIKAVMHLHRRPFYWTGRQPR